MAVAVISAAVADTTYTSASYVQDGLITQWDGIDNVGTGTHDPTTNVWKDLKGNNDLTIVAGRGSEWRRGIGLYISNIALGKAAAYGSETAKTYKTIEIVYKMTATGGRIMFWGGDQTRYVVFDKEGDQFNYVYFDGKKTTAYSRVHCYVPTSIVATYDDNNTVTDIYCDGAEKVTDTMRNTWNPGDNYVTLGWRSVNNAGANYGWEGEIYAIRLYSRVLTPEEIAKNNAIDAKRFFTTAMYDTDGLISFWDAKDNVGEGSHDSTSAIWKNLVSGGQNLTPSNSQWSDNALVCNGSNQSGAYGKETMEYKTLEVLFRNERNANTWLFSNGINRYCILGMWRAQWQNWCGVRKSYDLSFSRSYFGKHSLSWISSDPSGSNAAAFVDGIRQEYHYNTAKPSSESNGGGRNCLDDWGVGGAFVQVGGRSTGTQNFKGNMYAVRAYSTAVTQEKVWQNNKIDTVRYANAMRWSGGNGSFGTVGNWRDVDVTTAVPGVDNTVDLTMGTYKITLDQDHTVGAMRARNGHISYAPSCINATVDMGGNTLTVLDGYQAEAYKGANDNRFARLNLTNGVFNAESVLIGALSDRIPDDYDTWINYLPALTIGSGSLCLDGLVTTGAIRKAVQLEGAHTKLHVAGGANLSCDKLNVYGVQDGSDRAQVEFTGMGTVATINGLWITRDVDMTISDGANVTLTGCSEYLSSGGCWASSIGRSFVSTYGNSSRMVVDNATFTITFRAVDDVMYLQGFAVGAAYKAKGGSGTSVTLQNNARLSLTGSGRFFVGIANDRSDADSKNCVLNVLDGSTFDGSSTKLEVGANGDTSFCGVNVSNATVNCNVVYFGSAHSVTASSNDFLNVFGAAARINIASTDADSLKLRMGAQLKFTLPENGFAATPIVTAGGVTVYDDENNAAVDPVKLVIDGTAFNGSEQTLIECATDSTAAFQKLIANHTGQRKGKLLIKDGGTKLVYVKPGMKIVIR